MKFLAFSLFITLSIAAPTPGSDNVPVIAKDSLDSIKSLQAEKPIAEALNKANQVDSQTFAGELMWRGNNIPTAFSAMKHVPFQDDDGTLRPLQRRVLQAANNRQDEEKKAIRKLVPVIRTAIVDPAAHAAVSKRNNIHPSDAKLDELLAKPLPTNSAEKFQKTLARLRI